MSWGGYFMFYDCPVCGKKFKWSLEEVADAEFGQCPQCQAPGLLTGESKDLAQGEVRFGEYEEV